MSFYQGIMPAQVPKTQELGRFAASFRRLRPEKSSAPGPHQGLCPWLRWELCPQTPVIGSRSLWLGPSDENFCVRLCLSQSCAVLKRLKGSSCPFVWGLPPSIVTLLYYVGVLIPLTIGVRDTSPKFTQRALSQ